MSTAAITPEMGGRGKTLDANSYATKKTIAQGMLDIALLTANASQLKYVLQVGHQHEFYTLMVWLISISIVLQVLMGALFLSLNLMRDCRLHLHEYHTSAVAINYVAMGFSVVVSTLNLLISAFDPGLGRLACQGVLYVMLGSSFNINKSKDQKAANVWNNVVLAMGIVTTILNVIISAFDMRETDMVGFNSTTTPSPPSQ